MRLFKKRMKRNQIAVGAILILIGVLFVYLHPASHRSSGNSALDTNTEYSCEINLPNRCEVIHVAVVCAGFGAARQMVTLVKSLVFFRKNPLHFHFIYDTAVTYRMLKNLFDTWSIPEVTVSLYSAEKVVDDVSWVPNKHYSGVYGLLKLVLPKLLPAHIEKVLVLDADMLCLADIGEVWSLWRRFNESQALGLVENQSDWYLGKLWKGQQPWPALGRGFNSGLILMDLAKLRSFTWMALWRTMAEMHLPQLRFTSLADQDIFNSVVLREPSLLFRIPCQWNVQLSDNAREDLCLTEFSNLKIIHWNSPHKLKIQRGNRYADFFHKQYEAFLEFDGNLLRHELFHCHNNASQSEISQDVGGDSNEDDECLDMRLAHKLIHRVHLLYCDFNYQPKEHDVALVTQLSLDRLPMLEQLLAQWTGPASVALYISDAEAHLFMEFYHESSILAGRRDVAYHMVYKEGAYYPTNKLRNVAMREAPTEMVFLIDVDFLPAYGAYELLREAVADQGGLEQKALVIPAFETLRYRFSFPKSKAELLDALDTGQLQVFRQDVWTKGHAATDYDKWRSATNAYAVTWTPDFEPYIVVDGRNVPAFDTRFVGFGWNKVAHIMELDAAGYDFIILPNVFIIHFPHAPSYDIVKYRSSAAYRKCLRILKGQFLKDITKRYNRRRQLLINEQEGPADEAIIGRNISMLETNHTAIALPA